MVFAMAVDLNRHSNLINQVYRYYSTDLFKDAIPKGSYVLDCGAGDGAVALPLAREHGCKVMCLATWTRRGSITS